MLNLSKISYNILRHLQNFQFKARVKFENNIR